MKHAGQSDAVVEYWAGNPSIEIAHGHLYIGSERPDVENVRSRPRCTSFVDGCVVLAGAVPCYMTAPEFCEFVGAFTEGWHREFLHCRVLHGHNPEEYLIAIWVTSPEVMEALIRKFDDRQYNAIEAERCKLYRIVGCTRSRLMGDEPLSPSGSKMWRRLVSSAIASDFEPQVAAAQAAAKQAAAAAAAAAPTSPKKGASSPPACAAASSFVFSPKMTPQSSVHAPKLNHAAAAAVATLEPLPGPQLEAVPCSIEDLFTENLAGGPLAAAGPDDKARCAVCLEFIESNPHEYKLTEMDGGVPLTILCGHTFHARCLYRWCDTSCPVCRFQQHPTRTSCCEICGQHEGLLICLVCGTIGCMAANGAMHAQQHYEATGHTYALEVMTQRVWDYAGNGYVYRLLCNSEDGKMVEHSVPDGGALPSVAAFAPGKMTAGPPDALDEDGLAAAGAAAASHVSFVLGPEAEAALDALAEVDAAKGAFPSAIDASAAAAKIAEAELELALQASLEEAPSAGVQGQTDKHSGGEVHGGLAHAAAVFAAALAAAGASLEAAAIGPTEPEAAAEKTAGADGAAAAAAVGSPVAPVAVGDAVLGVVESGAEAGGLARGAGAIRCAKLVRKQESIVAEFNDLLTSQLSAQRNYYEERQHELEAECGKELKAAEAKRHEVEFLAEAARRELRDLLEGAAALELDFIESQDAEEKVRRKTQQLEELFNKVSAEQKQFEGKAEDKREQERRERQQRAEEVEELQEQIKDMERYLQMQKRCQVSGVEPTNFVVTERDVPRGPGASRAGGKRRR